MKTVRTTLACILFAALSQGAAPAFADGECDASAVKHFDLEIRDRAVQLEPNTLRVTRGDCVGLAWTSDEQGSLHLHGYDIEFEVGPGEPTVHVFEARATGRFPVTSHGFGGEHGHGHEALLYLEVYPE